MTDGSSFHNFSATNPRDIAFDEDGNLHVAKSLQRFIEVVTPSGVLVRTYTPPSSRYIDGILIDKAGNRLLASDGNDPKVIITDNKNNLINKLGVQGFAPTNVATSPNGDVWIADVNSNKILIYSQ